MYNTVKASLPDRDPAWICVFEPSKPRQLNALRIHAPDSPVLTKVIVEREEDGGVMLDEFEHRVMMVRDPRDVVISGLLFRPLVVRSIRRVGDAENQRFLAALEEKEAEPTSWSVHALHGLADELGYVANPWDSIRTQNLSLSARIADDGYFAMAYEDFVDTKFGALSDYLGFEVSPPESDDDRQWLSHISRSKGYGAWRDWFLESDVDFFRGLFGEFCTTHGYDDWELAPEPSIDPTTSSLHVRSRLSGRKEQMAAAAGEVPLADFTADQLSTLEGQASDGVVSAIRRAAQVRRHGPASLRDETLAYRWSELAAWMGDRAGMSLLAESYRGGLGVGINPAEAEVWHQRSLPPERRNRSAELAQRLARSEELLAATSDERDQLAHQQNEAIARIAELEDEIAAERAAGAAEVKRIKNSTRYKVGSRLARVAATPKNLAAKAKGR